MELPAQKPVFTAADYLAWEPEQLDRHEYLASVALSITAEQLFADVLEA